MKSLFLFFTVFFLSTAGSDEKGIPSVRHILKLAHQMKSLNMDWEVGDQAEYEIRVGFLRGQATAFVREWVEQGPWVEVNIRLLGKHKVEALFDGVTGEVLKLILNGEEEEIPDNDLEVIDQGRRFIRVPAGAFDTDWARLKDTESNETSDVWASPTEVPLLGLVQAMTPTKYGRATLKLKEFDPTP